MPSSYTSSLRLTLPVQGELSGSWGNTVNTGITALVDTAVAGTASITMTAADYTLSNNNGVTDEARAMFLVLGGTPGAARNVICPAVSKLYFVTNNSGFAQTVKTASGTGISVPNGASMVLRCDGTNVVEVGNTFGNLTYTGTLTGSTGILNIGSGQIYKDGSGNVGIGTSSPAFKLDVQGASGVGLRIYESSTGNNNRLQITQNGTVSTYNNTYSTGSGVHAWQIGNTEFMRLDSSGNLGLGVTPSAWSGVVAMQLPTGAALTGFSNTTNLAQNAYYNGSWRYISTAAAALAQVTQGAHLWFTAPSGTAGNTISFTQAMTLSASGVLALGAAIPALNVGSSAVSTGDCSIELGPGRTGNGNSYIDLVGDTTYTDYGLRIIRNNGGPNTASVITHRGTGSFQLTAEEAAPITFATSSTERARIDSSGNLGLGAVSPGNRFYVNGPQGVPQIRATDGNVDIYVSYSSGTGASAVNYFGTNSNHPQVFLTNNTERARITSGGDFLVGTTDSTTGKFAVRGVETTAYNTATFGNGTDVQSLDVLCGRALTNGTVVGVASSLVMTLRSSGFSAGDIAFATGNNEIARITSTGNVLVGTTSTAGAGGLTLQSIVSGYAIVNNNNAGATGYVFQSFRRSSVEIGSITQNGTTAVLFNTTSDRRLKDNIAPAPSASDVIDAIEIVSHDWKAAPDEHVTYGVIAQDLALVAPQAVLQGDDGEEVEKTWGVDYSKLVPMLIKEIQSLRARVAALEAA